MTWRFSKASSVHRGRDLITVGRLLICEFLVDPIAPFETAEEKVLS